MTEDQVLRYVEIAPYTEGPVYKLLIWDTGRRRGAGAFGRCFLGYRMWMNDILIYEGDEYSPSPTLAIDSDASVASLLDFLTDETLAEQDFIGPEEMLGEYLTECNNGIISGLLVDGNGNELDHFPHELYDCGMLRELEFVA